MLPHGMPPLDLGSAHDDVVIRPVPSTSGKRTTREILVEPGEAAEFGTMTPHAFAAVDGPAELIMIFDRDGQRAHVHHERP
jgi:hypothetical protein